MTWNTQKLSEKILSRSFFFLGFIFGLVLKDITFLLDDDKQYISRGWIYKDIYFTSIQDLCLPPSPPPHTPILLIQKNIINSSLTVYVKSTPFLYNIKPFKMKTKVFLKHFSNSSCHLSFLLYSLFSSFLDRLFQQFGEKRFFLTC